MPPRGRIAVFYYAWYEELLGRYLHGGGTAHELAQNIDAILRTEAMLAAEGALILKYWLHLTHEQQHEQLDALWKKADALVSHGQ